MNQKDRNWVEELKELLLQTPWIENEEARLHYIKIVKKVDER